MGYAAPWPNCRQSGDMRVLVIDDEPDVLLLCRVNLEIAGHEVVEASDGLAALALARSASPDVIVLDVMLPHLDGLSVLADLEADERTSGTPVILLTAKTQVEDRLAGWRAGCSDYVTKPFSPVALTDAVERTAAMSSAERNAMRSRELERLIGSHQTSDTCRWRR
jgi:DNA-binding response OmpR family regulator